jgi:hypothetical protein
MVTMILSVLYAKRVRKSGNILTLMKRKSKMHCVVNKDGIVVALFLLECDAQDFIHNCRTPYSRKDYTVEYREKYEYVTL